ncbi:hypothetical protein [Hyphomicrobium sp.]|uniref:hypothetical protein n=1 Tax=Hyphomicrobium sp. TaxID=82 RepID=UPI0035630703
MVANVIVLSLTGIAVPLGAAENARFQGFFIRASPLSGNRNNPQLFAVEAKQAIGGVEAAKLSAAQNAFRLSAMAGAA